MPANERFIEHVIQGCATIPEVETVTVRPIGSGGAFTIVVNGPSDEAFDRIYEWEGVVRRSFASDYLDFYVLDRRGRMLSDLVNLDRIVWQRQSADLCA